MFTQVLIKSKIQVWSCLEPLWRVAEQCFILVWNSFGSNQSFLLLGAACMHPLCVQLVFLDVIQKRNYWGFLLFCTEVYLLGSTVESRISVKQCLFLFIIIASAHATQIIIRQNVYTSLNWMKDSSLVLSTCRLVRILI